MPPHAFALDVIALFSVALYLAGAGALARPLLSEGAAPKRIALITSGIAVILHFAVLFGAHRGALDLHFFAALSVVAAVIAALTLIVNLVRPVAALGVIVFPLAAFLLAIDQFLAPPTAPIALDWQIKLHVTLALISFGVLSIAALLAVLLAMQERALRARQFGAWLRALPPLTLTETLMFRLIAAGFVLLTLALLSGVLFVHNILAQDLVQKTALSVLAWIVFGVLLIGRAVSGWRGTRAVNLTLIGMIVLLLAFFGSKFVLEMVLHKGI
ncbi:MAG TPA: cytochrome c biogenesis protein CcsA [Rhodanobacteraceae bacterium]|nr:cytochrome c biogenesis protein CcsA [Rhodanobacteraceae bacterium]